jgi:hypothetical protein
MDIYKKKAVVLLAVVLLALNSLYQKFSVIASAFFDFLGFFSHKKGSEKRFFSIIHLYSKTSHDPDTYPVV